MSNDVACFRIIVTSPAFLIQVSIVETSFFSWLCYSKTTVSDVLLKFLFHFLLAYNFFFAVRCVVRLCVCPFVFCVSVAALNLFTTFVSR